MSNETATRFLDAYAAGGEVEGGWLYAKALQQSRLDFTPDSLSRLDHLLAQVRERAKPTPASLDTPKGRNFMALLAYYVIEMLRRRTGAEIQWHDRDSALAAMPPQSQLPEGTLTRLVAVDADQGVAWWPLGWLEAQLAQEGPRRLAGDLVEHMVQQVERFGPVAWWRAAFMAGRMAAWEMMAAAASGGQVHPTMLSSPQPGTFTMLGSSLFGGPSRAEAVQAGAQRMELNPDGATWQVMGYDGILQLDARMLDAVMVVAATYGERPFMLKIAFPYLPARDGEGFAILQPVLRETTVDKDTFERLFTAIERGIQSLAWPDDQDWNAYRNAAQSRPLPPAQPFVMPVVPSVPAAATPLGAALAAARAAAAPVAAPVAATAVPSVPASAPEAPSAPAAAPKKSAWRMW